MNKKRNFLKKGQYKPAKIDPNDPEVIKLMEQTKREQEKNDKLRKIDPKMGDLFVNSSTNCGLY